MAASDRYTVEDPRFSARPDAAPPTVDEYLPEEPPRRRRSCLAGCLLGCLGGSIVLLVVAVLAGVWLFNNWQTVFSKFGADALKQSLESTDLPEIEKQQITVQIDRLAEAVKEKRINAQQLMALMESVAESPLLTLVAASAMETRYLAGSGLTEQEQTEARQTLRRYLRGAIDGQIAQEDIDLAMAHVADELPDGGWQLRNQVSDAELREFFKLAKEQADAALVAAEPEDIDPSNEFRRIIDEALGEAPPPMAEDPEP